MTTRVSPDPKWRIRAGRSRIGVSALVVMAKAPLPGMVKTRLVPPLSPEEAAELYRCLLLDMLENLKWFDCADLFLAFAPADRVAVFEKIAPPAFTLVPQRGENLGARMRHVFEDLFTRGYRNVVLIGSDLPVFPLRWLTDAFARLSDLERSVVLGPNRDGGYYLIGMSRLINEIFHGIPWSSDQVLAMTLQRLNESGAQAHLLPRWFDIDNPEDLRDLGTHLQQCGGRFQEQTAHLLAALLKYCHKGDK